MTAAPDLRRRLAAATLVVRDLSDEETAAILRPTPRKRRPPTNICGDESCVHCGHLVRAARERKHREVSSRTVRVFADLFREAPETVRPSRAQPREVAHVERPLTPPEQDAVLAALTGHPLRSAYDRWEWTSEVWDQLVRPTALVARREAHLDLSARVTRAINRAQARLRKQAAPLGVRAVGDGESRMTPRRGSREERAPKTT